MAITQYYVDPAIAGNSGTGTIGDPFGDLQYALDTVTRDAANGDQINIKAGTAEVLAAVLSLSTYGTPTEAAPLFMRGYTTAANDGGMATISGGGGTFALTPGSNFCHYADLRFTNTNSVLTPILQLFFGSSAVNCQVDTNVGTSSLGIAVRANSLVANCSIYGVVRGIQTAFGGSTFANNYISLAAANAYAFYNNGTGGDDLFGNIFVLAHAGSYGYYANSTAAVGVMIRNNIFVNTAAGTAAGVFINDNVADYGSTAINNIIMGWSGAGGVGLKNDGLTRLAGYNAFYNNTTPQSHSKIIDLGNDVTLAADPFTDAANGNFSLTTEAKAALRSLGWPPSYLGAHANTDPHITIGAMQYGPTPAASGGGRRPRLWSM